MEFEERLQRAIKRGSQAAETREETVRAQAMNEDQFRRLHTQYRLELCEHIERCMAKLPGYLPGFQYENVASDRGWGAGVNRDDADFTGGRRGNVFSRLEIAVRPYSSAHVLDLNVRGTIRNKEVLNRTHFQLLQEVSLERFMELVDAWALEFAELYAARR
ncbi:MAG: hypothetical protein SGJ20_21620 [Planctomycetota bacterium]|nr:hypothetical protein [Planctomycetota bacterium]